MGPRDLSVVERCPYYGGVLTILESTDLYIYSSFDKCIVYSKMVKW